MSRRALNAVSLKGSGCWCCFLDGDVACWIGAPLEISGSAVSAPLEIANGGGVCFGSSKGFWLARLYYGNRSSDVCCCIRGSGCDTGVGAGVNGGVDSNNIGWIAGVLSLFRSCAIFSKASFADSGCKAGIAGVLFNNKWTISFVVLRR